MKHTTNFFKFIYALFFTRDDDLDILQLLFASIIIVALIIIWKINLIEFPEQELRIESLNTLRWLAGLLVVTAVPKWLVPTIAKMSSKFDKQNRNRWDSYEDECDDEQITDEPDTTVELHPDVENDPPIKTNIKSKINSE